MVIDDGSEMESQVIRNELCAFWVTLHRTDATDSSGIDHRVR
jgi:hypothetical protein